MLSVTTGYALVWKLIKMNRASPDIDNKEVINAIKKRLPSIIYTFALFVVIQTGFYLLYTTQRIMNFADKANPDTIHSYEIEPSVQISQLCLEFIYSCSLFIAICKAQPKREKKAKKESNVEEAAVLSQNASQENLLDNKSRQNSVAGA